MKHKSNHHWMVVVESGPFIGTHRFSTNAKRCKRYTTAVKVATKAMANGSTVRIEKWKRYADSSPKVEKGSRRRWKVFHFYVNTISQVS